MAEQGNGCPGFQPRSRLLDKTPPLKGYCVKYPERCQEGCVLFQKVGYEGHGPPGDAEHAVETGWDPVCDLVHLQGEPPRGCLYHVLRHMNALHYFRDEAPETDISN